MGRSRGRTSHNILKERSVTAQVTLRYNVNAMPSGIEFDNMEKAHAELMRRKARHTTLTARMDSMSQQIWAHSTARS